MEISSHTRIESWEFVTGEADSLTQGYASKKQKAFYSILQCIGQKNVHAE